MKKVRIFIASPGDLSEERDIVSNIVVPEVRRIFGDPQMLKAGSAIDIEAIRWETHGWPAVGVDAQEVINREIGQYDVLVGLMWKRFGTPTKRSGSGTGEEFERAYEYYKAYKRPYIMFYFRTTPFYTSIPSELAQFRKVIRFRRQLEKLGVLFWEYESPLHFERDVREHLIRQIAQLLRPSRTAAYAKPAGKERAVSRRKRALATQPAVFIAYSREDFEIVRSVYLSLREAGFQPWFDRESLVPGQDWRLEVLKAVRAADIVLVFLSSRSVGRGGFFHRELRDALVVADTKEFRKTFLIPVRLDPIEPPDALKAYQWVDYFADGGPERLMLAIRKATQHLTHSSGNDSRGD